MGSRLVTLRGFASSYPLVDLRCVILGWFSVLSFNVVKTAMRSEAIGISHHHIEKLKSLRETHRGEIKTVYSNARESILRSCQYKKLLKLKNKFILQSRIFTGTNGKFFSKQMVQWQCS